ncbi:MAG: IS21 family transposase [Mariprofundaceae bacterium]
MSGRIDEEGRIVIRKLHAMGRSHAEIARQLGVTEGAVRYHLRRQAQGAEDGRRDAQHPVASDYHAFIAEWVRQHADALNLAALHEELACEFSYPGTLRSLQRYVRKHFPKPARRARRRVETPPGAQAQADWAEFRGMHVGGEVKTLYAFHLQLSHSRMDAVIWSERKDELAWLHVHNEALMRLGGVPAVVRIDNEKTAISHGAGAHGEVNRAYASYARTMRFHVDACAPRSPEHKGKVERRIRDQRLGADPRGREWMSLAALQAWTDERLRARARRRICPPTGTSVWEAWQLERTHLQPLPPVLPQPFDVSVMRKVSRDCLVCFEQRQYSVPFRFLGRELEVRGCADTVQVYAGDELVAEHPRHTRARLVLDPAHYEGEATEDVLPPTPLGKMGRKLQELEQMPPEQRPIDMYAALAEAAR